MNTAKETGISNKSVKKVGRRAVYLLVSSFLLCVTLIGIYLWNIQPERQPGCPYLRLGLRDKCEYDRHFTAETMLIHSQMLPVGMEVLPFSGPVASHGTTERASASILTADKSIAGGQEMVRWSNSAQAAKEYGEAGSESGLPAPSCGIPHNVEYQSHVADQFCAACSVGGHCKAVGQYQDYISIFELDIDLAGLTEADFIEILAKIDERMAQYLDLDV